VSIVNIKLTRNIKVTAFVGVVGLVVASYGITSARRASQPKLPACKACMITTDSQSPPPNMLLSIVTSSGYQFSVDSSAGLLAGGTWAATFGSIDVNGNYFAPSYIPPYGLDDVTYTDSNGNIAHVSVDVEANPAGPAPTTPPTAVISMGTNPNFNAPGEDTPSPSGGAGTQGKIGTGATTTGTGGSPPDGASVAQPWEANLAAYVGLNLGTFFIVIPSTGAYPPPVVNGSSGQPLSDGPVSGEYVSPAWVENLPSSLVYVKPISSGGVQSAVPMSKTKSIAYPTIPCPPPGTTRTYGTVSYSSGPSVHVAGESFTCSWPPYVGVTVNDSYWQTTETATQYAENFKCVNGSWVWVSTIFCKQTCYYRTFDSPILNAHYGTVRTPWTPPNPQDCQVIASN
jgi:hypothetical protein